MMKEFKSESKRILDLMINSIYTNKEIFLRELISNASDALDKIYYNSLTDNKIKLTREELKINISINKEERYILIEDNGIGMNKEELEENLGTIAKSGSLFFKKSQEVKNEDIDIIGQFGVGFYSAFMVGEKIEVDSKRYDSDKSYKWFSSGMDGYEIESSKKKINGTTIKIYIKNGDENNKFLEENTISYLIKKYSDFIRYPIILNGKDTVNSMTPIWKKSKNDVKDEEYNQFYMDKFYDYENPLSTIQISAEGMSTFKALLFIPSHLPYDFYTKEYEKGLSLYANGVLIMDKCQDLLPDYYSFVKGVVDSEDLQLNISREMLQKSNNLITMAKNIETKINKELKIMIDEDIEKYKNFFSNFGVQLKYGVYNNFGMDKDKLKDLLMFKSSKTKSLILLKDYISNMKENQNEIYYASGSSFDMIDNLPQVEWVKEKDFEILYLDEKVDEFTIMALQEYDGKKFKDITKEDFSLDTDEEKNKLNEINTENKDLLSIISNSLNNEVEVKFTNKLKNHPICLTTKGNVSIEMEKTLSEIPEQNIKAEVVLEINDNHPISKKLKILYKNDKDKLNKYSKILYTQAKLISGLKIDNQNEITDLICEFLAEESE